MAELKFIVSMDSSAFKDGAKDVMAQVHQMSTEVAKEGDKMQKEFDGMGAGLGKSIGKYLTAFGGAAVFKSLIDNIVKVRAEFQKAGVAIETMLGSKEKADALMQEVKQIAASSPLEFGDITRATQQMLSFNIAAEDAPKFIRAIGDVSMGEKERFQSLSLAFSQMSATGKLMGQDLLQMINAGFNPLAEISRTTGKSIAQLKDEMSKGAISAKMVQQAFIDATSAGGKFFGMSENAAKTISGQFSMLSDAVNAAFNEVGQKSEGLISGAIEATTTLVKNYETILKVLAALVANYGVYKAAVAASIAIENAHGVAQAALAVKTNLLTKAQAGLNAVMSVNPYVAATVALSALVTLIVAAATATDEFDKAQERLDDAAASVDAATTSEMRKLDALNKKLSECEEGSEEYKNVKQQIIDQYSQYYSGLEQEWAQVGNLAVMYDKLTASIRNSIAARQLQSFAKQQQDAYDKVVESSLDKAYKEIKKKYGDTEGSRLYNQFFKLVQTGNYNVLSPSDLKKLREVQFYDVRLGKNAASGLVSIRSEVLALASDIHNANNALDKSIKDFKEMYQISDDALTTTEKAVEEINKPFSPAGGGGVGKGGKNDIGKRLKEQADEYDKAYELYQQQLTEAGRKTVDLEFDVREAELRAQRDSTAKRLKELELSKDKEIVAITRWYEDLRATRIEQAKKLWDTQKSNEGKKFYESEEYRRAASDDAYTEQEKEALKRRMDAAITVYRNAVADIAKEERSALIMFLRDYGDYQQRRLAIAQEYAAKIEAATTAGEKMSLSAQEREAYRALDFEEFKKSVNWESIFGDLDGISIQHLNTLREQLSKTLEDGTMKASDYKAVVEQINKVDEAIVARQNEWRSALGLTINELERRKRLELDAERAQQRVLDLTEQQEVAQRRLNSAKTAILATGIKVDFDDIKVENAEKILGQFSKDSAIYKLLEGLFGRLANAEQDLNNTTENLADANTKATIAVQKAQTTFASTMRAISETTAKVNANIQSATELIDTLGLTNTAFGQSFGNFAEASQSLSNAFADLQNGNIIGAANGVVSAIGSVGQALGALGIGGMGDSDRTLVKDIERLTTSNEALKNAVENLTNEMQEGAVADATEAYRQILEDITKSERNTMELLSRSAAAYNNGFLGIGGKGSSNSRINSSIAVSEWEQISRITNASVRSAADFWRLTSKQMSEVAKRAPEIYAHIKDLADDGYKDAAQFMDEYIGYWRQLEEAANAYNAKVTGVSIDTIVGDFTSALADMDSSAEDFAENFEKYLRDAIINALVSNEFEPLIKTWYDNFVKASEVDGIDASEQEALRKEWDNITEQGLKRREQLREAFDWGAGSAAGGGAYGAVSSFTQEQGDELNGRLTAIQIGQQRNNESLASAVATLQQLSVVVTANQGALGEMRNLLLIGNGHLEDIARYTKATSQNSELLQEIATKIKTL